MPRKTLALISGLVLVTVVLFVIALKSSQQSNPPVTPPTAMTPSPTVSMAHSVLSLSPDPINVLPGGTGKVDVNINTSDNAVTAVQLELSYDPKVFSNVKIVPGPLFLNSVVLINKNNPATGRFTYAIGKSPSDTPASGTGSVATITFTVSSTAASSQLTLLPSTLVTARGITTSVLKSSTGAQVIVGTGAGDLMMKKESVPPSTPSAQ